VHVDGEELVGGDDRVVVEHAHGAGAGAHGDGPFGLEHLVVDAADDRRHLDADAPGEDEQIGLAGAGAHGFGADAGDVEAAADEGDHFDRAAGAGPGEGGVERGGEDAAADVFLKLVVAHVAAQHALGVVLADLEICGGIGGGAADGGARHFHSRAPRRQT
jgi:hypothetical protein